MALIDTVPTTTAVLPTAVKQAQNGRLPASLLRNFDGRGALAKLPSYGMQALHIAAWGEQIDGFGPRIDTRTVGRYRSFARQEQLLYERADPGAEKIPGRPWYRFYNGLWWSGKPGKAMVATPGTSNHGWGCADDVAEERTGDNVADAISDRQLTWMRDNAPDFGWGLETRKEPWHWHWIRGDVLPARAVDVLTYCDIPIPADIQLERPPFTEVPDMPPLITRLKGFADVVLIDHCSAMPLSAELLTHARTAKVQEFNGDCQRKPMQYHPQTKQWLERQLGYSLTPTTGGI